MGEINTKGGRTGRGPEGASEAAEKPPRGPYDGTSSAFHMEGCWRAVSLPLSPHTCAHMYTPRTHLSILYFAPSLCLQT